MSVCMCKKGGGGGWEVGKGRRGEQRDADVDGREMQMRMTSSSDQAGY